MCLLIAAMCIFFYYLLCYIISLWTGCSCCEAAEKIHSFINGNTFIPLSNNGDFQNEVWENIKNIIGEKRFQQHVNLSKTAISSPLLWFGVSNGIPFVSLSIFYVSDNEKLIIEHTITNIVLKYLKMYGYNDLIFVKWTSRYDLNMPVLQIKYTQTQEEQRRLNTEMQYEQQKITIPTQDIIDEESDDDLNE